MNYSYDELYKITAGFTKKTVIPNVKVTPKLAQQLLTHNLDNRPISNNVLKGYTAEMKQGKWLVTNDNVSFDIHGNLSNGQHRLMAVANSGTIQIFNIQCGTPKEAFVKMDIAKQRSASDAVYISGVKKNYATLASAIKLLIYLQNGGFKNTGDKRVKYARINNEEVIEYLENKCENRAFLEEMCSISSRWAYKGKFLSSSTYAAFAYWFGLINRTKAIEFFELLSSGHSLEKGSPILALRNKLADSEMSKVAQIDMTQKVALIVKAWNYYRRGATVSHFKWDGDKDKFPVPI